MADEKKIRLIGLDDLSRMQLGDDPGIKYETMPVPPGAHGEVTLFTAMLAMAAVSTVAAFLLKKHDRRSFEEDIEIIHPDGRVEKRRIRWTSTSSEAPEASIIAQIRGPGLGG